MKTPQFIQRHFEDQAQIRAELLAGLQAAGAYTSPKYLYDQLGSKLFEAICELPEYYPTRIEASIFKTHAASMASLMPRGSQLIDLGAGNCQKAANLFETLKPARYVAVDISVDFLQSAMTRLQYQYPDLDMVGVGIDFAQALTLPSTALNPLLPSVFFYPGSSIGNFTPSEARTFLKQIHAACGLQGSTAAASGLLIGVDLVKDTPTLEAAYDDALGVTAAFNRNMLLHINRLMGSDFALADWQHVALYNETQSRIEMHLEAKRDVALRWAGGFRNFKFGERIHTENSYKWAVDGFSDLLMQAGFKQPTVWTDDAAQFAVMWASA